MPIETKRPTSRPQDSSRGRRRRRLRTAAAVGLGLLVVAVAVLGLVVIPSYALEPSRVAWRRGDLDRCQRLAREHLSRFPWHREAAILAARSLSRLKRAEEAEPYFAAAGRLTLEDRHLRAMGFILADDRDAAKRAYEGILEDHPADLLALRRLAAIALSVGDFRGARSLARRIIDAPGGAIIGHTLSGVAHHDLGMGDEAVADFEKVLELDPELRLMPLTPRSMFWSYLSKGLLGAGRTRRAIECLNRALGEGPDADLMNDLGTAHNQLGEHDQAERCWRTAAEWAPRAASPRLNLGRLALARGRTEEAVDWLGEAVERAPKSREAVYGLSLALRQAGRTAEAERLRAEAERLKPAPLTLPPVPTP